MPSPLPIVGSRISGVECNEDVVRRHAGRDSVGGVPRTNDEMTFDVGVKARDEMAAKRAGLQAAGERTYRHGSLQ